MNLLVFYLVLPFIVLYHMWDIAQVVNHFLWQINEARATFIFPLFLVIFALEFQVTLRLSYPVFALIVSAYQWTIRIPQKWIHEFLSNLN